MARLETWYKQDLKRPLVVHKHTDVFNQDSKGNLIGVEVYSDGEPVALSGSISGYCLLADGTTVPAVGASRSGNKASVLIPQTAYSVPGPITITIKNVDGDNITTLCATVGVVRQSVSGNLVNPGSVVTDWSNDINAQLQAVQTAADNVGAIVAAPFDENTVYVAGNYVTNNGNLYRITADHAAGVAWSGTAKVQCTVGHELEALNKHFIANWNLIDPDAASGNETDFLPVELNVRYNIIHAQSKGRFQYGLSFYDSNKTMLYISQLVDESTDGTNYSYSCTFSQSAIAYVKLKINSAPSGIDTTDFSKVYFGKGSEYIEFADYNVIHAIKKVKDDVADLASDVSDLNSALGTVPSGKTVQGQIDDNANDISDLKSAFSDSTGNTVLDTWQNDCYYTTSSSATTVDVTSPTQSNGWRCAYLPCTDGDIFYYSGTGNTAARPYAFLSSDGTIISKGSAGTYDGIKITAPSGAAYVIFNANGNYQFMVIIGELNTNLLQSARANIAQNTARIDVLSNSFDMLTEPKTESGTAEVLDTFTSVSQIDVSGANAVTVRNAQIFEPKYPGQSSGYGVSVTRNDDGTYTINGTATSSAFFNLNQSTRTGTDNLLSLHGKYTIHYRVLSGGYEKGSYEGSTYFILGIYEDNTSLLGSAYGDLERTVTGEVNSDRAMFRFRITSGVHYDNMRIQIMINKGETAFEYVKYSAPVVVSDFNTLLSAAENYLPALWLIADTDTATIIVVGRNFKSSEPSPVPSAFDTFGILEKYNDRADLLAQLFTKPLFLIYTDIHGNAANLARINTWYLANKPVYVSDVYCLGDMVDDQATDSIDALEQVEIWGKTLKVIGNHDVLSGGNIPGITSLEAYNKYIKPYVSTWNVIQPSDAETVGKTYFYKDYKNSVRVIVLDTYFYTQEQHAWFVNTLESARVAGLAVIVAQHEDICTATEKQPLTADYPFAKKHDGFTGIQYRTYGDGGNYQTKRDAVDAFIGAGGSFICWLSGHTHADMTGLYKGGTNGDQLSVVLSNASNSMTSSMRVNGYAQDCFTYMAIDTDEHLLYLLRIGVDVDKWYHKNLFLCYNHENHNVVEYNI